MRWLLGCQKELASQEQGREGPGRRAPLVAWGDSWRRPPLQRATTRGPVFRKVQFSWKGVWTMENAGPSAGKGRQRAPRKGLRGCAWALRWIPEESSKLPASLNSPPYLGHRDVFHVPATWSPATWVVAAATSPAAYLLPPHPDTSSGHLILLEFSIATLCLWPLLPSCFLANALCSGELMVFWFGQQVGPTS